MFGIYSEYVRDFHPMFLMLVHRLRRWPNIKPTLSERHLFAWQAPPEMTHIGLLLLHLSERHFLVMLLLRGNKCKSEGFGSCDDFPVKQISSKIGPISSKS